MKRIFYFLPVLMAPAIMLISFTPVNPIETGYGVVAKKRTPDMQTSKWVLNKANSGVSFSITHLVVSKAEGVFKSFDGTLESSKADFSDARIVFSVQVASVDTDNEGRDKHLRSDDYFDAEKYPEMKFESNSLKASGKNKYKLTGNLTIKDVTKTVVFDVNYTGAPGKAVFACTTTINRYDFHVSSGGAALGKDVTINVKVEMDESK